MTFGLTELLRSGRGVMCLLLVIIATALVLLGILPVAEWTSYTKWIITVLVVGRTITHAMTSKSAPAPDEAEIPEARTVSDSP